MSRRPEQFHRFHRNVQRAAAEIDHQKGHILVLALVVGEGGGARFVDDTLHAEACQFAGGFGRTAAVVIKVRRHTDYSFLHRFSKKSFCILLEAAQYE